MYLSFLRLFISNLLRCIVNCYWRLFIKDFRFRFYYIIASGSFGNCRDMLRLFEKELQNLFFEPYDQRRLYLARLSTQLLVSSPRVRSTN